MSGVVLRAPSEQPPFHDAFARVRSEFGVPDEFPADVVAAADAAARTPVAAGSGRSDARDIDFVTIDPAGSRDLDQAFHAARRASGGYRVSYAIADVAAIVEPGGAIDREAERRGVTVYLPDGRAPMLPDVLCEGAASLLAGQDRAALVWTIDLDGAGVAQSTRVARAVVRSRAALSFVDVQRALDAGTADDVMILLGEIGELRRRLEEMRGGISLDLPSQEVVATPDGGWKLEYRAPLAVETWNAQISLLTGMEAAKLMVAAHVGILRTLPAPEPWQIARLRRTAAALGVDWREGEPWDTVARGLDRARPSDAALLIQATHLLRGAAYVALDASNTTEPSAVPTQAGVGAPYAHVTAPMRRFADRYANEVVLAACAGTPPPEWAVGHLSEVASTMEAASRRAGAIERAAVDAVECALLAAHVGERFDAIVVDQHSRRGAVVQIAEPAVVATVDADVALGTRVTVRVTAVDPVARRVVLRVAD